MLPLYKLSREYESIVARSGDGELSAEDAARLDTIPGNVDEKLANIVRVLRTLEATAAAAKGEIARLREVAARAERSAEWLERYTVENMQRLGLKRGGSPGFTVSVGTSVFVEVDADAELEDAFLRTKVDVQPNKQLLLETFRDCPERCPAGVSIKTRSHLRLS